jgi:TRAP-type C4-dicarboxylate transport system substrate-binding protein
MTRLQVSRFRVRGPWAFAMGVVTVLGAMSLPAAAQSAFEMKLTICTRNDPNQHLMTKIKEELEKRSSGRITAPIYPGCQLGSAQRSLEGLQLGTIELHATPPSFATGLNPALQATDAPGLIKDFQHAGRVFAYPKFREKFDTLLLDKGIGFFALWPHSTTNYVALAPLRRLDDFKGKKIRVLATKMELALMQSLGAAGVPIDFGELLPALQARTVDGVRSSLVAMAPLKYFDVAKYATVVNDAVIPIASFISIAFVNKLPRDLRDLVFQVGKEAEASAPAVAEEFTKRAEQMWVAGGGELIQLSDAEYAEFKQRARSVGESTLSTNPATKELYALFKEAAEKTE